MQGNRLQLNPGKTELAMDIDYRVSGSGSLLSLVLDGVSLQQSDPACNLGVLLDS